MKIAAAKATMPPMIHPKVPLSWFMAFTPLSIIQTFAA
jgi:hypothetical protein